MSQPLDSFLEVYPDTPTKWEVCRRCRGTGELGGYPGVYSGDDFAADPDFFEDYRNHRRVCEDCGGRTTIQVIDEAHLTKELREEWEDWTRSHYETEAIYEQERRMGA